MSSMGHLAAFPGLPRLSVSGRLEQPDDGAAPRPSPFPRSSCRRRVAHPRPVAAVKSVDDIASIRHAVALAKDHRPRPTDGSGRRAPARARGVSADHILRGLRQHAPFEGTFTVAEPSAHEPGTRRPRRVTSCSCTPAACCATDGRARSRAPSCVVKSRPASTRRRVRAVAAPVSTSCSAVSSGSRSSQPSRHGTGRGRRRRRDRPRGAGRRRPSRTGHGARGRGTVDGVVGSDAVLVTRDGPETLCTSTFYETLERDTSSWSRGRSPV